MNDPGITQLLNGQTGKIGWQELVRHFARGVVVCVSPKLDLLETAAKLIEDRADDIRALYEQGALHRARDEDAIRWQQDDPEFWTVVVAPWVLVQEMERVSRND
jgi:hypothetical protein